MDEPQVQGPESEDEEFEVSPRPERCPLCGSDRIVPILYGLPTAEAGDEARRGELIIGGCMPMGREWGCGTCGFEFPGDLEVTLDG